MKLAVLADIHSNWFALQAVAAHLEAWKADQVIVAGDIVNRGPRPRECLEFVLEKEKTCGWLTVRGNHEDYVINLGQPETPLTGAEFEVHRGSYWTFVQLHENVSPLQAMPFQQSIFTPDGGEARIVHASMRGNRDGIFPKMDAGALRERVDPAPALICVGHTHLPFIRRQEQTLIVNAGSAGLPFDGDRRPAYAQLTYRKGEWTAEVVRLEYDYPAAEKDLIDSGFMDEAGALAGLVQIELSQARSLLFQWAHHYQARALAGEITMEESVAEFRSTLL
jgi:predicted phosphodiesterase